MFPWVFEWDWDIGHYALLGAWYCVLAVMGAGLAVAFLRTLSNLRNKGGGGHH
jgi:hypothetical protein